MSGRETCLEHKEMCLMGVRKRSVRLSNAKTKQNKTEVFGQMHAGFSKQFKESLLQQYGKQTAENQEQKPEGCFEATYSLMGAQFRVYAYFG